MVVCPISPATSDDPWYNAPSRIRPPPIPVPIVNPTTLRAPAAAPRPPFAQGRAIGVVVERRREPDADRVNAWRTGNCASRDSASTITMPAFAVERARARRCRRQGSPPAWPPSRRSSPRITSSTIWAMRSITLGARAPVAVGLERMAYSRLPSSDMRAGDDVGAAEVDADDVLPFAGGGMRDAWSWKGSGGTGGTRRDWRDHSTRPELAHAPPMAERAPARAVPIAGRQEVVTSRRRVAGRAGRTRSAGRWVQKCDRRRAHRRGEVQGRGVIGHEHARPPNQLGGPEQRELPGGVDRASWIAAATSGRAVSAAPPITTMRAAPARSAARAGSRATAWSPTRCRARAR